MTALSYAAEKGNEAAVQLLLERKADVNAKDFDGSTALHWAALNGHEFAVRLLLERHDTDVNAQLFGHDPECDLAGDSWGGWMGGGRIDSFPPPLSAFALFACARASPSSINGWK